MRNSPRTFTFNVKLGLQMISHTSRSANLLRSPLLRFNYTVPQARMATVGWEATGLTTTPMCNLPAALNQLVELVDPSLLLGRVLRVVLLRTAAVRLLQCTSRWIKVR